ncbi:RNA-directed DNA polymerase from mobile element jockey [Merluccius polli]|uniref:RNA-directed DNA polymerase from mobile element jockey n=1 Tax=Merluccius polli TaxID=89951 RepID=A0AA47NUC6_MERPO|nr:RNA-directed DNA polymerase from mobile element jockey [Merluccius polli]
MVDSMIHISRINKAILKHRNWNIFNTVNNYRLVWDPRNKPSGLLGGHINIRSILSKCEQVQHLLQESNFDYLSMSESWLNENSPSAALSVPGFNTFRTDRKQGRGGGVICFVRDTICCNEIEFINCELECLGLNIVLSPVMSFTLIVIYRPPSSNVSFFDKFRDLLKQCHFNREVVVMGDFNVNWQDRLARQQLKQVTDSFSLSQIIRGPTRITNSSSTQIDLFFSNMPDRISSVLGPILFSLYINDLPYACQDCEVIMYADDTVIFVKGKDHSDAAAQLTRAMVKISDWLHNCCLQLNNTKTVAMFFAKTNKVHREPDVFIAGQRIQIVKEYKYLGIVIDCHLTFKNHISKICKKVHSGKFPASQESHVHRGSENVHVFSHTILHKLLSTHLVYC